MKPAEFVKVYDLRTDIPHIQDIQTATLQTAEYGLKPDHGLFGSDEWWFAIEEGLIPKLVVDGVISRVYMSGHNDFPEFDVTSDQGKTSWERLGNDRCYVIGRRVHLIYVKQQFKVPLKIGRGRQLTESSVVLEIWVEG